jgi:hypothetical protein
MGRWPDDMETHYRVKILEDRIAEIRSDYFDVIKLIFGPPLVGKNRSDRHIQFPHGFALEDRADRSCIPIERLISMVCSACSCSGRTYIYGLENAQVPQPDMFQILGGIEPTKMYSTFQLCGEIKRALSTPGEYSDEPLDNFRILPLSEYMASNPEDELLEHELSGGESWSWVTTDYWWSNALWNRGKSRQSNQQGEGSGSKGRGQRMKTHVKGKRRSHHQSGQAA